MRDQPPPHLLAILGQLEPAAAKRHAGDIAETTGLPVSTVRTCLQRAETAGLVEARGARYAATAKGRALLTSAGGARKPRRDLRQRVWTALRALKKATVEDLVTVAARGDEGDPGGNAGKYLTALARAGYVRALPGRSESRLIRWLLVRDTGARAPVVSRGGTVTDPNTGEVCDVSA